MWEELKMITPALKKRIMRGFYTLIIVSTFIALLLLIFHISKRAYLIFVVACVIFMLGFAIPDFVVRDIKEVFGYNKREYK